MKTEQFSTLYKYLKTGWQTLCKREDGANLVLMALVIPVLLGFAGLAVDGSNIYFQTQRMQISADAGAIGGARKLAVNAEHSVVDAEIRELAFANAADEVTWNYINNNRGVHVVTERAFPAYFARIYGHNVFTVTAEAEAQYETVTGASGLFPFTLTCNCDGEEGEGTPVEDEEENGGSSPTVTPTPGSDTSPSSGTVQLSDNQNSSYGITYLGQTGNTWSYQVEEIEGRDLEQWLLNMSSCVNNVVSSTPSGASVGTESSTGVPGIYWDVNNQFTNGTFSFTLDNSYPSGVVQALAKAHSTYGTVSIRGPICDGTNTGEGSDPVATGLCLPTLEFETDTAGAALVAGQIIDTEWAAWGLRVTTTSPSSYPAMVFNTANPTGGDTDLGTPNESYGGPGIGSGGGPTMPGRNSTPEGKVLIVAESSNSANPDDRANGGTLIFSYDYPIRLDEVKILDIDDSSSAGTVKAYSDSAGTTLVATGKMQGLGDNSVQTIAVNGSNVRRLEIAFPKSGAVASIVSCRSATQASYHLSNLIWSDTDGDGLQDAGEAGIPGVSLELYVSEQNYVIATSVSNMGGEYLFSNLPLGDYEVKIAASNYDLGGALYGSVYSPKDVGAGTNDDTKDSDFDSGSGRAPALIAVGDNTTVDGGFVLPDTGQQSAIINLNENSQYEVSLVGTSGNTWTYQVRKNSGLDLSYWALGIVNCMDKIVTYNPTDSYSNGTDASTGFVGIKWTVLPGFTVDTFSFTLDSSYQARPMQALIVAETINAQVSISGPDCSVPNLETPSEEVTPSPTSESGTPGEGTACMCDGAAGFTYGVEYTLHEPVANAPGNFGWLRWEGDLPSAPDLAYNINYPWESPIIHIGDWIKGTTGNTNASTVATALEQWIGKRITIPIYDQVSGNGSNAQYRVCSFAVFELTSWDRHSKTMKGIFVETIVRSDETDDTALDYGVRDVRVIR